LPVCSVRRIDLLQKSTEAKEDGRESPDGSLPAGLYISQAFSLHPALHGGGSEISPANKAKKADEVNTRKVSGTRAAATTCEAPNQQGKGCECQSVICAVRHNMEKKITTKTNIVFKVVYTRTNSPAPSMILDATFLNVLKLDL
jgi:hypothetical protein